MKDQRSLYDPDERIFTLSDIKKLIRREKKKIIKASCLGAVFAFSFFLITVSPKYQAHATFREGAGRGATEMGGLEKVLGSFSTSSVESQTIALISSYQVLKPLVERMGTQAVVPKFGLLSKVYRRVRDNFLAEGKWQLSDVDWFVFRNVAYEGDRKISYGLRFEDREHFSILSGDRTLATGSLGSPVTLPEAVLTIVKVPEKLRLGRYYPLAIQPWISAVKSVRSQLRIATLKNQKSIFTLQLFHRDRYFGTEILNALMEEYRNYLKRDHDQVVGEQLTYLEEKQGEIYRKMSSVFDEYTEYLQTNLSQSGHLGLRQEVEGITREYKQLESKLLFLDLEYQRLCRMEADPKAFSVVDEHSSSPTLQEILSSISNLKQQRDWIELSLPAGSRDFSEQEYEARKAELKGIRERTAAMQQLLDGIDNQALTLFDPDISLASWAARLADSPEREREDLTEYLGSYIHLLSMQEKIVQEQVHYGRDIPSEFQGIDLKTAQNLFINYNNKLDQNAQAMSQLSRLNEEMGQSNFEISSLSAVLTDSLSQRLIARASDIALKLKDEKHRSEKERDRWSEELSLQKNILKEHLDQLFKVELLKSDMIRDKIAALQEISLSCISGQISVLQERLSDWIKNKKNSLLEEKNILEVTLRQLREGFADLPDQWQKEKWLGLKTEMGIKMVQTLTELVESKTISSHLHHIESKPLDFATLPSVPCYPGLLVKAVLGAFLAGFAVFSRSFFKSILEGFPTSSEKLQAMRYPILGVISPLCDGPEIEALGGSDLDVLRQISIFLGQSPRGKVIGIIEGKGPDYSYALAELCARMSLRTLIIRCDFNVKFGPDDLPGLLQVWKEEKTALSIRKRKGYDFLPSGGYTPYGTEVVRSHSFQELLEKHKSDYDFVFLVFRSPLNCAESSAPLSLCDKAIVTIVGEPTEQLTPFVDWAYHKDMCRLVFLGLCEKN